MKYKLETIPVWDALHAGGECLLCTLMTAAERRYVDYYLGSSVMNPETRLMVNDIGFCPAHTHALLAASKPQAMSLLCHTHLQETRKRIEPDTARIAAADSPSAYRKALEKFSSALADRQRGCLICTRLDGTAERYAYTIGHLWAADDEFRLQLEQSRGFCLYHLPAVLQVGARALKKRQLQVFAADMISLTNRALAAAESDVYWMTQMFKSENRGKEWNGCEQAHARAVLREFGTGRGTSPGRVSTGNTRWKAGLLFRRRK